MGVINKLHDGEDNDNKEQNIKTEFYDADSLHGRYSVLRKGPAVVLSLEGCGCVEVGGMQRLRMLWGMGERIRNLAEPFGYFFLAMRRMSSRTERRTRAANAMNIIAKITFIRCL